MLSPDFPLVPKSVTAVEYPVGQVLDLHLLHEVLPLYGSSSQPLVSELQSLSVIVFEYPVGQI